MRIAITGATGFVGSALIPSLTAAGHTAVPLVRGEPGTLAGARRWDPENIDPGVFEGIDAVVHLAGENVAGGRWTAARRQRIAASRGPVTERLCQALAGLLRPPAALISASATGLYGDRGDEVLDEDSAPGRGFLADVAKAWEAGTAPAASAGIRVVNLRIGMVLDPSGGALAKMLTPFRLGLGGRMGSGRQWITWISRTDLVNTIRFAIEHSSLRGPVLAGSPAPVTNRDFARALGSALHRPAVLPLPSLVLRLLFGAMADELLLAGQRALPRRLTEAGFSFAHAELSTALREMIRAAPKR